MMCLWKIAFSPGLVRGLQQNLESTALSYCVLLKDSVLFHRTSKQDFLVIKVVLCK